MALQLRASALRHLSVFTEELRYHSVVSSVEGATRNVPKLNILTAL
jgi:hypothetical protein